MAESKIWQLVMAMGVFFTLTLSGCGAVVPECEVEYGVQEDWGGGYTAVLTLRNRDDAAWDQWSLDFELPPGQTVLQSTGAEIARSGPQVELRSRAGEVLDVSEPVTLSLEIGGDGPRVTPATFAMQGAACVGGRDWVLLDLEDVIDANPDQMLVLGLDQDRDLVVVTASGQQTFQLEAGTQVLSTASATT